MSSKSEASLLDLLDVNQNQWRDEAVFGRHLLSDSA